jgi:DNA-binding GntR family transcriptional regulator
MTEQQFGAVYMSKSDMVTALLRDQILSGELRPSGPLRQRDIAVRFGVSQTPVREALRRLESEGLVVSDTHRGATVAESKAGALEENYQIRAALESLGAMLAARVITDAQVDRLEELNATMRSVGEDAAAYLPLNREFHFTIYEAADSPLLLTLMRLLWKSMHGGPLVLRSHAESTRQHQVLIDALRARDGDAAAQITRDHILGSAHLDPDVQKERRLTEAPGRRPAADTVPDRR